MGASPHLSTPPLGADGVRLTVNSGLSTAQTVWNLRSAYNVAALNCLKPEHAAILAGYKAFLKANAKALTAANRSIDREFRDKFGKEATARREVYLTQVYNYFAQPPTLGQFCDAALAMASDGQALKPAGLDTFAATELPRLDAVFANFYRAYDQWKTDAALWDARYAPTSQQTAGAGPSAPVSAAGSVPGGQAPIATAPTPAPSPVAGG
jgi:hypothetical protein